MYGAPMADDETILALEHEMSVLIRRLRRRIAERARLVHPELAPVESRLPRRWPEHGLWDE